MAIKEQKKELKNEDKKPEKEKVKRKGAGVLTKILITVVLLAVIIGGSYVCLIYDYFKARTMTIDWLTSMDPQFVPLAVRYEKVTAEAEAVIRREELVKTEEARLQKTAAELDDRDKALAEREARGAAAERAPTVSTQQQEEDLKRVAAIYNKMTAEDAATVLSNITNTQDMLAIISQMPAKRVAELLQYFDAAQAAWITQNLMK